MRCAWQEYLNILPQWMRQDVDLLGKSTLQELRLRIGKPPDLILGTNSKQLNRVVRPEDLQYVINCASQYSPWVASTMAEGYLTAPGGHRIGICGAAVCEHGIMRGIRDPSSLCIRVARDFPGIAKSPELQHGSILIIGPPGSGKTTFLRDLIRQRSDNGIGSISAVDERGELFPQIRIGSAFDAGKQTDVLLFSCKAKGILTVLKTMGPCCIAVDEITSDTDCSALQQAGWCGVEILATAHAASVSDLMCRPIYRCLLESKLFSSVVVMRLDKAWNIEKVPV